MKQTGGCHCGQVRYEVIVDTNELIDCNCSICMKKGHLLAFTPEENFKLIKGERSLKEYRFHNKVISHLFCKNCGVNSFGRGSMPDGTKMVSINARCLDNIDLDKCRIIKFDGKSI